MPDPVSNTPFRQEFSDHDLLIRIDERTATMGRINIEHAQLIGSIIKRVETIENWQAAFTGQMKATFRLYSAVSGIVSGVIIAAILYFLGIK